MLEANFKPETDRLRMQKLAATYNAHFIEIFCHADSAILLERFNARIAHKERHPGHHAIPMDAEGLHAYVAQYTPLTIGGLMQLNTSSFSEINGASIVAKVQQFAAIPA